MQPMIISQSDEALNRACNRARLVSVRDLIGPYVTQLPSRAPLEMRALCELVLGGLLTAIPICAAIGVLFLGL